MKEFFKEMLFSPLEDRTWDEYAVRGLLWITVLILFGLVVWMFGWAIDSWGLKVTENDGIVIEKSYESPYTVITYVNAGNVDIPIFNEYDATYNIKVNIDGSTDNVSLNKNTWNNVNIGDKFCFKYSKGRFSRQIYIKSFCHEN